MKLSSILTINAIREVCEDQNGRFYAWIADTLRRIVVEEGLEEPENETT